MPDTADGDFEPQRIIWLAPLTIVSAVILRHSTWPPVAILMAEHVAAWLVTVELLTRLA
jgi:hypothetical protein